MIFGIYSRCTPLLLGTQVSDVEPSWSSYYFNYLGFSSNFSILGTVCPNSIENGVLHETCDVRYASTCDYTCNNRFRPNKYLPQVTCHGDGKWGKEGMNLTICTGMYYVR